jgi:hypothetical protein
MAIALLSEPVIKALLSKASVLLARRSQILPAHTPPSTTTSAPLKRRLLVPPTSMVFSSGSFVPAET